MKKIILLYIIALTVVSCNTYITGNTNKNLDEMVLVEAGQFEMGHGDYSTDYIIHSVYLNAFYIAKTEVTQSKYEEVMQSNPSVNVGSQKPVDNVSWFDAVSFCNELSISEGLEPCYNLSNWHCDFSKNGYRLPTEAEWEYATRGGKYWNPEEPVVGSIYSWEGQEYAWEDCETSQHVATKKPNKLDLYDMTGNVHEWCYDWYSPYTSEHQDNPIGTYNGSEKVFRGGSYRSYGVPIIAKRYYTNPNLAYEDRGFRIVRSAVEGE